MSLKFVLGTAAKDHQASLLENYQSNRPASQNILYRPQSYKVCD